MLILDGRRHRRAIKPVQVICLSFLTLILVGTFLLTLPISAMDGNFTRPLDAAFTATSATCVTGLVVFDTYVHWSLFGRTVILLLIQLGGLGVISFTTFFAISFKRRLGLRDMRLAGEQLSTGNLSDIHTLFGRIIKVTFFCEGIGMLLLMLSFVPKFGAKGIWYSTFTAVSAYCNAGFDVFGFIEPYGSLSMFTGDWIAMLVVPALIISGGLGFFVFHDVLTTRRMKETHRKLSLHTKVVFATTAALILIGFFGVLLLEWHNNFSGMAFETKVRAAFFSSATPRTAGFSVMDYGSARHLTLLLTICLMFIGASPGSTGGGIKTTTAIVLVMTVYSVIRGRSDTVIFRRRVDKTIVYKALSIVILSVLLLGVSVVFLDLCEPQQSSLKLAFEAVSAFSTTGLSAIGSQNLGSISRMILILLMYIGRVGPVSFLLMLNVHGGNKEKDIAIPEGKIFVG